MGDFKRKGKVVRRMTRLPKPVMTQASTVMSPLRDLWLSIMAVYILELTGNSILKAHFSLNSSQHFDSVVEINALPFIYIV